MLTSCARRIAHARIVRIDASAARAAPGVAGVLTGADLEKAGLGPIPCMVPLTNRDGSQMTMPKRPAIAIDHVRFVGDIGRLRRRRDPRPGADAAELIEVEYEELPAVSGTAAALRDGAPLVWDFAKNNVVFDWDARRPGEDPGRLHEGAQGRQARPR